MDKISLQTGGGAAGLPVRGVAGDLIKGDWREKIAENGKDRQKNDKRENAQEEFRSRSRPSPCLKDADGEICGIAQQGKKGGEKDGVKGKGGYKIPLDEGFEHPRLAAGGTQKTGEFKHQTADTELSGRKGEEMQNRPA